MPPNASRTVFVANIPYDVSEEQIANVFSEVGPVSNVEIKFDPVTGRSKGYAFVQFYDSATAHSAVRNLQDVPINGRPVRIELSTDDGPRNRRPGAAPGPAGFGRAGLREQSPSRGILMGRGEDNNSVDVSLLPLGQEPPAGQKATDAISKTLAEINPGQMQDVMASMKELITKQPDQARQLLSSQPQLAYALFQAMLLMNIVDPSVLQRIQPLPPAAAPPAATAPPPAAYAAPPAGNAYPPFPPQGGQPPAAYPPYPPATGATPQFRPPPGGAAYNAPPPPAQSGFRGYPRASAPTPTAAAALPLPATTQAALANLPEDQRAMLTQVLQLTPEQINALDSQQQASIKQLRQQFLGAA